ncbi:hypothetical protein Tco_1216670 [Tanacetum coccineum]
MLNLLRLTLKRVFESNNDGDCVRGHDWWCDGYGLVGEAVIIGADQSIDLAMSDSEDSIVTYTAVSSPFGGLSDIGSPGVDGPPVMLEDPYTYVVAAFQAPPSLDYVSGPEYPPLPEFVPKPVYPEFMPPEDEVFPVEEQPLPAASSDDDKDDDDDVEEDEDEEEEEEHPAPADSVPPPVHRVTARISIRAQTPVSLPSDIEVARLLSIPTPPPSPLSPWSSPLPQIPSPLLPVSSPVPISPPPLPTSPTYSVRYRAAMIRLRAETPSTSHPLPSSTPPSGTPPILPIHLPTPSPYLLLPSADHGVDRPDSSSTPVARPTGCFRADYGFVATLDREIRRDPERYVGYGITDTWDEMLVDMPGAPETDETELGRRMTNFVTTVRHDIYEIYVRLDDAQDERLSREAWRRSIDASDTARSEVRAPRTTVLAQQTKIVALRAANHTRQAHLVEILRLMSTLQTQKMAPKRTTRAKLADTTATTSMTNAQLKAIIDQGVPDALAARDADRNMNGDDSHNSGTGVRRTERVARECTYPDFM